MSTSTDFPTPDFDYPPLAPFWAAARKGELRFPRCKHCDRFNWYPADRCRTCDGAAFEWVALSGRGILFSWTVVSRALHPPLAPITPYISAIVAIEEDPSVRLVTRLVDCDVDALRPDMQVRATFADLGHPATHTGVVAPLFTTVPCP